MAFKIKQNDTKPNLPFQIFESDGVTPLDLTNVDTISIVVRPKVTGPAQPMTFKSACVLTEPLTDGKGYYDWQESNTAVAGNFEYEFEILWLTGDRQTVPVDSYFDLIIVDDIG